MVDDAELMSDEVKHMVRNERFSFHDRFQGSVMIDI